MTAQQDSNLQEVAQRIREMREIMGFTTAEMAEKAEVTEELYKQYESGSLDLPFTFIHKCALAFSIGMSDLLEGRSALLNTYTVTRKGHGQDTAREDGIVIQHMAPMFKNRLSEPYYVTYKYSEELQNKPIHTTKHSGQEFDYVVSGRMKIQVGDNVEYLSEGDSIFYNSSLPHGMIAVDGRDCVFIAMIMSGGNVQETLIRDTLLPSKTQSRKLAIDKFVETTTDENGLLTSIKFKNEDKFNFAFDVVDAISKREADKLAMIHIDKHGV
jgi:acetyl-CoA synthetase